MKAWAWLVVVPALLSVAVSPARAETVNEAWRSATYAFYEPFSVSVNPTDGSCWVADSGQSGDYGIINSGVVHLSAAGVELWRSASSEFDGPYSVSVNPTDGSCWVADWGNNQVVHLSAAGAELWRSASGAFDGPYSFSVNPSDGSCWVGDYGHNQVVHLSAAGAELWRSASSEFNQPHSVAVNPTDGSCWVADTGHGQVVHLSAAEAELWRSASGVFYKPYSVSANPTDGSCWVADYSQVVQLSAAGAELWRSASGAFYNPYSVSANPTDGSCWVADTNDNQVVHLSAGGAELWRSASSEFNHPHSVSVNPTDGSCWMADTNDHQVVHLSAAAVELWRSASSEFNQPMSISVNSADSSWWVADWGNNQVVHLSAAAVELWRSASSEFNQAYSVSVNTSDGSCWVADTNDNQVVHLSAAGAKLWQSTSGVFSYPMSVSVNPADGSCWVADAGHNQVVHLSAAGTELWRSASSEFNQPLPVSVNPSDGSCWVGDYGNNQLVHLSAAGAELWRSASGAFSHPRSVSVNHTDSSYWVADTGHGQVVHLSAAGAELWRSASGVFYNPHSVSASAADGSCWVADYGQSTDSGFTYTNSVVVHLSAAGAELWRSASGVFFLPSSVSTNPTDGSCWAADSDHRQVVKLVIVATPPSAEFSGAPTSGVAPLRVSFADQSTGSPAAWAWSFGDGDTASVQNPSYTYAKPGYYTVSLIASNTGGSTTATKPHYLLVSFPDVPVQPPFWALGQIMACLDAGIVAGYPDGTYQPGIEITRDQIAVYIARGIAGGDANVPTGPAEASFPDVPTGHWAFRHIEYVCEQNVVSGYDDGLYHPLQVVDRGQMAVYVARAMVAPAGDDGVPDPTGDPTFPDVPSTFWAYKHIEYCVEHGVVNGYGDGLYHPEWVVTRDQMAVYVARAFKLPILVNPFAGTYSGSYSGSEFGTWQAVIQTDGSMIATAQSPSVGTFSLTGTLAPSGSVTLEGSGSGVGGPFTITWQGTFYAQDADTVGAGTWVSSSGFEGNWSGRRQSGAVNPFAGTYSASYGTGSFGSMTLALDPAGSATIVIIDPLAGLLTGTGTVSESGTLAATGQGYGTAASVAVSGQFASQSGALTVSGSLSGSISADWTGQKIADPGVNGFAGNWSGTYSGSTSGTWQATVEADGSANGTTESPSAPPMTTAGTVAPVGFIIAYGYDGPYPTGPYTTITWGGAFYMRGGSALCSGLWTSTSGGGGSWNGQRH